MSKDKDEEQNRLPTEEGRLVIRVTRALFKNDIDETFRILGEYLDKHQLQVSAEILSEYQIAGRIRES